MIAPLVLSALAMGLLGSTHCVVMCGGISGALSAGLVRLERDARAARRRAALAAVATNAGRIGSYAIAGGLAGAFGALVDRAPALQGAAVALRLGAGLLLVGLGAHLAGAWRRFGAIERAGLPLWRRIEPLARRLLGARSFGGALALGALWGWMPCGLVYAALGLAVATGAAGGGALTMAAFGLGTAPALLAMGALGARVGHVARVPWVRRAAGVAVVAFGVLHVATAGAQLAPHESPRPCCAGHHAGGHP